jgi:hypothetical protein
LLLLLLNLFKIAFHLDRRAVSGNFHIKPPLPLFMAAEKRNL